MKKTLLLIVSLCFAFSAFSQTLVKEMENADTRFIPGNYMELPHLTTMNDEMNPQMIEAVEMGATNSSDGDFSFSQVELTTPGTLRKFLGNKLLSIDSISICGPINGNDFRTLWEGTFEGRLKIINLERAIVDGGVVPDYALFNTDIQYDRENGIVYPSKLEKLMLPEGITHIGRHAVAWATKLQYMKFPTTLKTIGIAAFTNCYSLTPESFELPENLEELGDQVFFQCRNLTGKIKLPSKLKIIDDAVFYMCGVTEVNFPTTLVYLGSMAFFGCNLKEANLPDNCYLATGVSQFQGNWELTTAHIPERTILIPDGLFYDCLALENINMPGNLEIIGDFAFTNTNISEISFPNSLTEIRFCAFQGCEQITTLSLPSSLKLLGHRVFCGCTSIDKVYCIATIPPRCDMIRGDESTPFYGISNTVPVYVPIGSKELYENEYGWDYFTNYIETDDFPSAGIFDVIVNYRTQDNVTYDLFGRKVEMPIVGNIYIKNGKKIILR